MLRRANRIVSQLRFASIKGENSINLQPKIENVDPYAAVSDVSAEAITQPIAETVPEIQELGFVADSFLSIYDATANALGIEVFAAIPIVV